MEKYEEGDSGKYSQLHILKWYKKQKIESCLYEHFEKFRYQDLISVYAKQKYLAIIKVAPALEKVSSY